MKAFTRESAFRRLTMRQRISVGAKLRVFRTSYDIIITDLSATGFRMESIYRFAEETRCTMKMDTFEPMGARVMWQALGTAGCKFERPLHPAVVDAIVARHPGLAPRPS